MERSNAIKGTDICRPCSIVATLPGTYAMRYFMLVRFVMMVAFAWMAADYYQKGRREMAWTFGALSILFQPIAKIALGRLIWNIVDIAVALFLIVLLIEEQKKEGRSISYIKHEVSYKKRKNLMGFWRKCCIFAHTKQTMRWEAVES